jgi:hypothetical protein
MNQDESPLYSYAINPSSSLLQPSSQPIATTVTIKKTNVKNKTTINKAN